MLEGYLPARWLTHLYTITTFYCMGTSFLERWPQMVEHGWNTTGALEVVEYEPCIFALNHLQLSDVLLCVRIPDCAGIFHHRTNKGLVEEHFSLSRASMDVSLQKGTGWVNLLCSMIDVIIPAETPRYFAVSGLSSVWLPIIPGGPQKNGTVDFF